MDFLSEHFEEFYGHELNGLAYKDCLIQEGGKAKANPERFSV